MRAHQHVSWLGLVLCGVSIAQEPCAQLGSAARSDDTIPIDVALQCLRSVPLQTDTITDQLRGLEVFASFQSDLRYLNNSEPARLYPGVDLLGGLDTLQQRIQDDFYSNEYDLQVDVYRLFASAYDGHLVYIPDIVLAFAFLRLASTGDRYPLVSVSSDGVELPQVFAYDDIPLLASVNGSTASPITRINGQDIQSYLNEQAAFSGSSHDPDANYNLLFPNELTPDRSTTFEEFLFLDDESEQTILTFADGAEVSLEIRALATFDASGVTDAASFFQSCCTGYITSALSGDESFGTTRKLALDALRSIAPSHDHLPTNVVHTRPSVRRPSLVKRQLDRETPVISLGDDSLAGYFPETVSDLAILEIPSFDVPVNAISDFQSLVGQFVAAASENDRTRLIVDLRGNGGGLNYLAHDTFRQIFPTSFPYDATNYRAIPLFDFTGRVVSEAFSSFDADDFTNALDAPELFSGGLPFNSRQNLDENNSTFDSWSDLFGPAEVPALDALTSLIRPNLTNILQTYFPVYPLGRSARQLSRPPAFSPENVILLQDGTCASACALFTEFMKVSGPAGVRQIVLGGRPQTGPQQGVGQVKGGQLGLFLTLASAVLTALDSAPSDITASFQAALDPDVLNAAVIAIDRAAVIDSASSILSAQPAVSVNFRNTVRQGDGSRTPLQYIYDAADARLFYTPRMIVSRAELWARAYGVAWGDEATVEGSTGHPSAAFGTSLGDIEVPENARSQWTVGIVGMTGSGGDGGDGSDSGSDSGSGVGGDEDGSNGDTSQGNGQDNGTVGMSAPFHVVVLVFAFMASMFLI